MKPEEILENIKNVFTGLIPFHMLLGVEVVKFTFEEVKIKIVMKPELVGNPHFKILHGGVTSTLLDAAGGMMATATVIADSDEISPEQLANRLKKLGTIDIRIDYIRPGRGESFIASAKVIRKGNKVAVTRMEMHNELDKLIALGTATYLVG